MENSFENIGKTPQRKTKSGPDFKYEREKEPERVKEILSDIESPKIAEFEYAGEKVKIEYIEVPAKEQDNKTIVLFPGFGASYRSYAQTIKELALYIGNERIICVSPPDSGKSSSAGEVKPEYYRDIYLEFLKQINADADGQEVTVLAHSRSDVVGMEMAQSRPDIIKNLALVNGIAANEDSVVKLMANFVKHITLTKKTFKYPQKNPKENFTENTLGSKWVNQVKSLNLRKKADIGELLSDIESNILILSSTDEFTDFNKTKEKILHGLPEETKKELHIEVGGIHDNISRDPEAFALKIRHWLETVPKDENS